MIQNFVPDYHKVPSAQKLTPEWWHRAMANLWFNANNKNLLHGKNVPEVEQYASGKFDLGEFAIMYKSAEKEARKKFREQNPNGVYQAGNNMRLYCLALICNKLNAGVALIQKIPVEFTVKAVDPLAAKKKKSDIAFIKNKPKVLAEMQPLEDKLNLGKFDIGAPEHSATEYSDNPFGLDLNEPDELEVFAKLLYSLKVETAFETILQTFWELTRANQVKLLEIRDQYKFGVSCHRTLQGAITGLPTLRYVHPSKVICPKSYYPDFRDNEVRFIMEDEVTPVELRNMFSYEIKSDEELEKLILCPKTGYCKQNNISFSKGGVTVDQFDTLKLNLIYCEIKSLDAVGIVSNPKKSKYSYLTVDPIEIEEKATDKIVAQNTYFAYWLKGTKYYFGIGKLGSAHRVEGLETLQTFSSDIYKSQEIGAVEASIGENKAAQEAYIKLMHQIRMALPPGKVIDMRFITNVIDRLTENNDGRTANDLLQNLSENNIALIDTDGFDDKTIGNLRPITELRGGVRLEEIQGYLTVIENCKRNISGFMGINDQVTGQATNPGGLNGIQEMLINASINSVDYVSEAIQEQERNLVRSWTFLIKEAVEAGGKQREAIVNMVGAENTNVIDGIEDLPSHQMSVKIDMVMRERDKQKLELTIQKLKEVGVLNEVDDYLLSEVSNTRQKHGLLAVRYKQFEKKQLAKTQAQYAQEQAMADKQNQGMVAAKQAEGQGEKEKEFAKGQVQSSLLALKGTQDKQQQQIDGFIKDHLQDKRNDAQHKKTIDSLETKAALETAAKI